MTSLEWLKVYEAVQHDLEVLEEKEAVYGDSNKATILKALIREINYRKNIYAN